MIFPRWIFLNSMVIISTYFQFETILTLSDFHFRNQNVLEGAIFFLWNQYSNIVREKLSTTALTITVIIKKVYILWKLNKFATDPSILY